MTNTRPTTEKNIVVSPPLAPPLPAAPPPPAPPVPMAPAILKTRSAGAGNTEKKVWAKVEVPAHEDDSSTSNHVPMPKRNPSVSTDQHAAALADRIQKQKKKAEESALAEKRKSIFKEVLDSQPITEKKDDYFLSEIQSHLKSHSSKFLKDLDAKITSIREIIKSIDKVFTNLQSENDKQHFKAVSDKKHQVMELIRTHVGINGIALDNARTQAVNGIAALATNIIKTEQCKSLMDSYKSNESIIEVDKAALRTEMKNEGTLESQNRLADKIYAGKEALGNLLEKGVEDLLTSQKLDIEAIVVDVITEQRLVEKEAQLKKQLESLKSEVQTLRKKQVPKTRNEGPQAIRKLNKDLVAITAGIHNKSGDDKHSVKPSGPSKSIDLNRPAPSSEPPRIEHAPSAASSSSTIVPPVDKGTSPAAAATAIGSPIPNQPSQTRSIHLDAGSSAVDVPPVSKEPFPSASEVLSTLPAEQTLSSSLSKAPASESPSTHLQPHTTEPPLPLVISRAAQASTSPEDTKPLIDLNKIRNVSFWWWLGFTDYTVSEQQRQQLWLNSKPLTEDTAVEYWDLLAEHPEKARGLFTHEQRLILLSGVAKKWSALDHPEIKSAQINYLLRHFNQSLPKDYPKTALSASAQNQVRDLIKNNYTALFNGCSTSTLKFLFKAAGVTKEFFNSTGSSKPYNINKSLSWSEWWRGETPLAEFVHALPSISDESNVLSITMQAAATSAGEPSPTASGLTPSLTQQADAIRSPTRSTSTADMRDEQPSGSVHIERNTINASECKEDLSQLPTEQPSGYRRPDAFEVGSEQVEQSLRNSSRDKDKAHTDSSEVTLPPSGEVAVINSAPSAAERQKQAQQYLNKAKDTVLTLSRTKEATSQQLLFARLLLQKAVVYGASNIGSSDVANDDPEEAEELVSSPSKPLAAASTISQTDKENRHTQPSTSTGTILTTVKPRVTGGTPQPGTVKASLPLGLGEQIKSFSGLKPRQQRQGDATITSSDVDSEKAGRKRRSKGSKGRRKPLTFIRPEQQAHIDRTVAEHDQSASGTAPTDSSTDHPTLIKGR